MHDAFDVTDPLLSPVGTVRPEVELMLLSARTDFDVGAARRSRVVMEGILDWNFILREAACHGIIPLMYLNLSRLPGNMLSDSILGQLRNAYERIARFNLFLTRELIKLLSALSDSGTRAIPCKGPVLAAAAYGNLSLRHFSDLDILVDRKDIPTVKKVLTRHGYSPEQQLTERQEQDYLRSHHEYKFISDRGAAKVEIQWAITEETFSFPFDFHELWKRREAVDLAGTSVSSLHPEDLLLILCVHGTKHEWRQLKWICDIAEILRSYQRRIDWVRLIGYARSQGGARMLYLGLYLAQQMFGARLAGEVVDHVRRDSRIKHLAAHVAAGLSKIGAKPVGLRDEPVFFYWNARERLRDKVPLLWKFFPEYSRRMVLPNERDHAFLRLPAIFPAGYYLVRPFRLTWERCSAFLYHSRKRVKDSINLR